MTVLKRSWDKMIKRGLYIYDHRDVCTYCLGCAGQEVGSDFVKNKFHYYYANGYAEKIGMTYEEWLMKHRGKRAFDCSGFLDWCRLGVERHDKSSWNYAGMEQFPSLIEGYAGACLWKRGHVGMDIGYGYFVHFPNWNKTCEFGKILEYDWTRSIRIDDIDYTGADAR